MQLQDLAEGAADESIARTCTTSTNTRPIPRPTASSNDGDSADGGDFAHSAGTVNENVLLVDWPSSSSSSAAGAGGHTSKTESTYTKSNGDSWRGAGGAQTENASSEACPQPSNSSAGTGTGTMRTRSVTATGTARSRRSVQFSNEVRCKPIPYKTPAELQSVWYSSDERADLHGRTKKVIKRLRRRPMSEEELLASKNESMRGVEHLLSSSTLKDLQQEQRDVIDAVVLLQEHWRVKGLPFDARELAYTSHALSASARDRARQFGKVDAEEMKEAALSVATSTATVIGTATGKGAEVEGAEQQSDPDGSDLHVVQALQM